MRFKFTLFLFILNCIAFGLIILISQKDKGSGVRTTGLSGLVSRETIEATRIELSGKGLEIPRVLERTGSEWKMVEPIQWPANYFAINRILNQLQFLEENASFSVDEIERTGQSLADYGLEEPWIQLTLSNGDESTELSVGNVTEIGNNFYLLGPDRKIVFVISRKIIDSLLVDLSDLRKRQIFTIPIFEIEALSLQINNPELVENGNFRIRVARAGNDSWIFEAPLSAEADATQVSNTINTLTAVNVVEFKELETSDPILQGLEDPVMQVTIHGNKRRQTLLLGNKVTTTNDEKVSTYYARLENNPTVFTVEAEPFDRLRKAEEALRERSILNFTPETLTSIDISENNLQIRLQKLETGNWQVIESGDDADIQPYQADLKIITRLIDDLKNLRASGFAIDSPTPADLDRLGFNSPRRTIQLTFGDKQISLLLAHPENNNEQLYARSDKAEYVYTVNRRSTLQMVPLNVANYRERTLETLPEAAQIVEIQLENLSTGETIFNYTLKDKNDDWPIALKDLPETELNAILALLDTLRNFTVKSYLMDQYQDAYPVDSETLRPWIYRLSAQILLPGDETDRSESRSYVFTQRSSGIHQVGASKLHDTIFTIPQQLIEALHTFTDDIQPPPEALQQPLEPQQPITPVPEPEPIKSAEKTADP